MTTSIQSDLYFYYVFSAVLMAAGSRQQLPKHEEIINGSRVPLLRHLILSDLLQDSGQISTRLFIAVMMLLLSVVE